MNKLPMPTVDDAQLLQDIAGNHRLCSYPHLEQYVATMTAAYVNYVQAQGVAAGINAVALPDVLVDALNTHFKKPPAALAFINVERQDKGHRNCPLCGSLHSGTVDHLIPRTPHPAFSIFSRNLVRACSKCNSSKNDAIAGELAGQRILHPYFDDCLEQRLVSAQFREHGPAPEISLQILLDPLDPIFPAVEYHVRRIVERTPVKQFLHDRWAEFLRKPTNLVPMLFSPFTTRDQLLTILNDQCVRADEVNQSLNNWESIFFSGLLEENTLVWLLSRLTAPAYVPGTPLAWV